MEKLKHVVNNLSYAKRFLQQQQQSVIIYTCFKDVKTNDWHCTDRV
jgi:hypothetical protein